MLPIKRSRSGIRKVSGSGLALYAFYFFCSLFFLGSALTLRAQTITATATGGSWATGATWVGGVVPTAGQSAVIPIGSNVTLDYNTPVYNNITVNGTLNILNLSTSTLTYSGNMTVSGSLINNGGIVQTTNGRTFQLSGTGTYIHNPRNNTLIDETIFSKSNETFSSTSNLIIQKWFDLSVPLGDPARVQSSNFGNVTLSLSDTITWEQNGLFMLNALQRVMGILTVTSGTVSMDNGNGATTVLVLGDVVINGTGAIIFASGPNRSLGMITGNFTDISTSSNSTVIMNNCLGFTQWTCNGSATIGHNFYGIVGSGISPGGSLTVQINGNLNITGGSVNFVSAAVAPLQLTVNGNTTISGSPSMVRFVDGNSGNLTFSTNNFTISGGGANTLMGGNGLLPQATGIPSITINNDFIINGTSNTVILDATTSTRKLRLNIGHDFTISGANSNFTAARHNGDLTISVANQLNLTSGKFIGQIEPLNTGIDSVITGGNFTMNTAAATDYFRINYGSGNTFFRCAGTFTLQNSGTGQGVGFVGKYNAVGNMNFTALGAFNINGGRFYGIYNNNSGTATGSFTFSTGTNFSMSGGYFRGIDNRTTPNPGTINFTTGNLQYTGGNFSGYYSSNNAAATAAFSVNGLLQLTFNNAATDTFSFIGFTQVAAVVSNLKLNLTVAGNLNITGANGSFISSLARGKETINITGSMNISGGKNSFNSYPASNLPNAHPVQISIGSDLSVNGGTLFLSAHNDTLTASVAGNVSVTNGELTVQAGNLPGTLDINGGYTQTGGTFYLHKNSSEISYSIVKVTVNSDNNNAGDFNHTGGTINFDNNTNSTTAQLYLNSPNVTFGGTGSMTMANPGTNSVAGTIFYSRVGNINFSRTSSSHSIQQVEQNILTGCTLTVVSGNLQIASLSTGTTSSLNVSSGSVLDLQGNQVFSNGLQPNSGIRISGRLRITRSQGFYDGTANAALNATGGMNYLLLSSSTIEYYGSGNNQVITGIGVGIATASTHKYANLEINFTGTPDVKFVYPANVPNSRSVFVKGKLILTNGELNLDDDHNPASGGRSIILERGQSDAITRVNGYIRSEVQDSSASVIWKIGNNPQPHIFPFGYNSTNYIPFTFELPNGGNSADTVTVSTYHTAMNNLPYPSYVTQVNDLTGADNSSNTVDRFWFLRVTGTPSTAHLSFVCTPSEMGTIINARAQRWLPNGWEPQQGSQYNISYGTYVQGATSFNNNWWTLASQSSPLPVTLLSFAAECNGVKTEIRWATASEINNDFFTVLKSTDGFSFTPIGMVDGNGNSSNTLWYHFTDGEVNSSLAYYKLRQTDFDGTETEYGPVVIAPCIGSDAMNVIVVPVSSYEIEVIIQNATPGKHNICLFGIDGKQLLSESFVLDKGFNKVRLGTENLAPGIYMIRVQSQEKTFVQKVPIRVLK